MCFPASAVTTRKCLIDNDTADDANYYNERNGYGIYVTGSEHFNGDCRRKYTSSGASSYTYELKSPLSFTCTASYAYLNVYYNNTWFTDPAAVYYVQGNNYSWGQMAYTVATVNQATRPKGWSNVARAYSLNSASYSDGVSTSPSGQNTGGYTGVDAIEFYITYN